MNAARRNIDRISTPRGVQQAREADALLAAGLRVMRRVGYSAATVAEVLAEAQLSTRAFYRHFESKDQLFLAIFEQDSIASRERMRARLDAASGALEKLDAWIQEMLSFAYEPRRARRTKPFFHEAAALRAIFPAELSTISAVPEKALVAILEEGRSDGFFATTEPETDATSILAVTWGIVEARFVGDGPTDAAAARARILSFVLRALGADLARARRLLRF